MTKRKFFKKKYLIFKAYRYKYLLLSIIFSLIILSCILYSLVYTSYIYKKDYWKSILLNKTEEILSYNISYEDANLILLPTPGIEILNLHIKNESIQFSFELSSKESTVLFSWRQILLGKWKIDSLRLKDGNLSLLSTGEGQTPSHQSGLNLMSSFQILGVELQNMDTSIKFKNYNESIYIEHLKFNHYSISDNKFTYNIKYGGGSSKGNIQLGLDSTAFTSENINLDGSLSFERFPVRVLENYYSLLTKQKFYNSRLSGEISFQKEEDFPIESKLNLTIYDLNFKDTQPSPPLSIIGKVAYDFKMKRLNLNSLNIKRGSSLSTRIDGELVIRKNIFLQLEIHSEYCELEKTLEYIFSFLYFKSNPNSHTTFTSELKIHVKNLSFRDYNFGEAEADVTINNSTTKISITKLSLFEGILRVEGIVNSEDINIYDFSFRIDKMNAEKCIQKYTEKKYLSGIINSEFHLHSVGDTVSDFENNLKIRGFVSVKSGSLRGYANFLKPILELGKLVNFLGPRGESGEFQSLESNFFIEKRVIEIPDLRMTGVGIDASGRGRIDFEKNVNLRIVVGLGGIAGKAFAVPIIYGGVFEKNLAYIDPLWLGSVYFGMTIAGPVTGGIAGSIATEYVYSTFEKIKNFFDFK